MKKSINNQLTFKQCIICSAVQEALTFLHVRHPVNLRVADSIHNKHI